MKKEEDEDMPYRMGLLSRTTPTSSTTSQLTDSNLSSPPTLEYPEPEHSNAPDGEARMSEDVAITNPPQSQDVPMKGVSVPQKTSDGHVRPSREVLVDVIQLMNKLRYELGISLDQEAADLANNVEIKAWRWLKIKNAREDQKRKGEDEDVEMNEEDEDGERKDPIPDYRPTSTMPEPSERAPSYNPTPSTLRVEEMEERIQQVEKDIRELQWVAGRDESKFDDKISVLEARLAALEVRSEEEEEPWVKVKSPRRRTTREHYDRPTTRSMVPQVEEKVDAAAQDIAEAQNRIREVEGGVDEIRRRLGGMEIAIAGVQTEVKSGEKRIVGLETKWEEMRLKQAIVMRDHAAERILLTTGVLQRLTKLERRQLIVEYRIVTTEAQLVWEDNKLRALWGVITAPTPAEALTRTAALNTVWTNATEAYKHRVLNTPSETRDSRPNHNVPTRLPATIFTQANQTGTQPAGHPSLPANPARLY